MRNESQQVRVSPATASSCRRSGLLPLVFAFTLVSCATVAPHPGGQSHDSAATGFGPAVANVTHGNLRVMTLNIAHGRGDAFHQLFQSSGTAIENLDSIAALLRRETPDVTSLQEADARSFWNGNFDHVDFLARRGNFEHSAQGVHVDGIGLEYGTALLAKHRLRDTSSVTFSPRRTALPKGFVVSTIAWPENECIDIDIVSVHLDFARESVRREQAEELIAALEDRNRPIIVTGDFNTEWGDANSALRMIARRLNLLAYRPEDSAQVTHPNSGKRLDWILVSPEIRFHSHRIVRDVVSDHFAVVADLAIDGGCSYTAAAATPGARKTR